MGFSKKPGRLIQASVVHRKVFFTEIVKGDFCKTYCCSSVVVGNFDEGSFW
jgi:hypothetical protein